MNPILPLPPDFHLSVNQPPNLPDLADCTTQRQIDTKMTRKAIDDFCDTYPGAGEIINQIGDAGKDSLVTHILDTLHPKATDMYSDVVATMYDMPFGSSI